MLYFAYGSNMCTNRLRQRVPSASARCSATLAGYRFHFHKRSTDRSGKGNALRTHDTADIVRGVIFEIDPGEKGALDEAEGVGHGYVETTVTVIDEDGNRHQAFMYVAEGNAIDNTLQPYTWYKRFVVEGARQHGLHPDYIAQIEEIPAAEDPNAHRTARESKILEIPEAR